MATDTLRPTTWDSYYGQRKLKDFLQIKMNGTKHREEPLAHILLTGPPGTGKTSIAALVAQEMGCDFESVIMPIKPPALRRIIQQFEGILFLDEIHRMTVKEQETLLPLLEDGYLQLDSGARIETDYLTVIGATTELNKVIDPLCSPSGGRFLVPPYDPYKDGDMAKIVRSMAAKMSMTFTAEQAILLGKASGGVPRNAKQLVEMARDLDTDDMQLVLKKCRITEDGFTEMHLRYLTVLNDCGGVAGLEIIGAHLGLPKGSLIDLERLLVKRGTIEYSKQGRQLLGKGYKVLK